MNLNDGDDDENNNNNANKNLENVKEPGGKYLPDIKKSINRLLNHLQNHGFHLRENMTLFMHGNAVMKQCEKNTR